jgi:hypothetical protein
LVEHIQRLRKCCLELLGDATYRQAMQVFKTASPDTMDTDLEGVLTGHDIGECRQLLEKLLFCEQQLHR